MGWTMWWAWRKTHACYGRSRRPAHKRRANISTVESAERVITEFVYQTKDSWSRSRRVIAKAEHLEKGANPRFVVTSLSPQETIFPAPPRWGAQSLYEEFYCARGDMENRIKEQMMLFADRTSTSWLRSNQIRLYFSTVGLPVDASSAAVGVGGHRTGQSAMQHGALKVAQDRGPGSHHGTQNLGVAVDRLSLSGTISPGAPAVASCSSALLRGRSSETSCAAQRVGRNGVSFSDQKSEPPGRGRPARPPMKVRTRISGS